MSATITELTKPGSLKHAGWFVVELPGVQKAKLRFLLERGAKVKSAKLLIEGPNGTCTLDDFGRVEWITGELSRETKPRMDTNEHG